VIDQMSIDVANCLQVESYVTLGRKGSGDRDRTTFSIEVSTPTSSTGDLLYSTVVHSAHVASEQLLDTHTEYR
jgi:hypothetical protein